jgi:hypothetical protein
MPPFLSFLGSALLATGAGISFVMQQVVNADFAHISRIGSLGRIHQLFGRDAVHGHARDRIARGASVDFCDGAKSLVGMALLSAF